LSVNVHVPQTIAVKFNDNKVILPYVDSVEKYLEAPVLSALKAVFQRHPDLRMNRMFPTLSQKQLETIMRKAHQNDVTYNVNLLSWYKIVVPDNENVDRIKDTLVEIDIVEKAYVEGGPTFPPSSVNFSDDSRAINQGYQTAAPIGVDARYAWTITGGDGTGIQFVDIENGWTLNHDDLISKSITLISGLNRFFFEHGTRVLGVVVAVDNTIGGVGIAPNVSSAKVVSQWTSLTDFNTADAIISAGSLLNPGDVMLIEHQTPLPFTSSWLPAEAEGAVWDAIKSTTTLNIIVIEPAGNGGTNLDTFRDSSGKQILDRASTDFKDSGAIMVGAATSTHPHSRIGLTATAEPSNFGSRIDCYAWGENVDTTDSDPTGTATSPYTSIFCCTSAASAIIAGAALCIQGIAKAKSGFPIIPRILRKILTNPAGTVSASPSTDLIGIMPDLAQIIDLELPKL
jgi:hypothetical protein